MMMLALAFAMQLAGFAALAAAMPRHRRQLDAVVAHLPPAALRMFGVGAIAGGLLACNAVWNIARAIPAWLGLMSVAAMTAALLLSFAPRVLPAVAVVAPLLAGLALLW